MKNYATKLAILCAAVITFTACDNNDNPQPTPEPVYKLVTSGTYIINEGNEYNQQSGTVTLINNQTWTVTQNVFETINNRALGLTPNHAIIYGNKMYIAVSAENTIEVVDKNTLKSIKQINTIEVMGKDKGQTPREIVGHKQFIYVTTYSGYVAAIDTTTYQVENTFQTGPFPEGICQNQDYIYTANSNQSKGNGNITQINLQTKSTNQITDPLIQNPVSVSSTGNTLYILDLGQYDAADNYNQTGAAVLKLEGNKTTKLIDATMMAMVNVTGKPNKIYTINAPYSTPTKPVSYNVTDLTTGQSKTFTTQGVENPAAIAVDPATGYVYITSYKTHPEWGGADYSATGYVNVYNEDGTLIKTINTGVGPTTIIFNTQNIKVED